MMSLGELLQSEAPERLLLCDHCGRGVKPGEAVQVRKRSNGEPVSLHPRCVEKLKRGTQSDNSLLIKRVNGGLLGVPEVPWSTETQEMATRVHPRFLRFAKKYSPAEHKSALLLGPSGSGKTLSAAAAVRRLSLEALASDAAAEWFAHAKWITAHKLVKAPREHALGQEESRLVERCRTASLLVIDEVGYEPPHEVLFDVIDDRYSKRLPTVVTSGLNLAGFVERYGDAMRRRLSGRDAGQLVDVYEGTMR